MKANGFNKLVEFLTKLEEAQITYSLAHQRDETVMVNVAIPGERWEIEFFEDGTVEIERFRSNGEIDSEAVLSDLFNTYLSLEPNLIAVN
jgi:hypothetical protein